MAMPSDFFLFPSWLCLPLDSPLEAAFFVGFFTDVTLIGHFVPGLGFGDNLALDFVSFDVLAFERDDFDSDFVAVLDFARTCFSFSGAFILFSSGSTLTKRRSITDSLPFWPVFVTFFFLIGDCSPLLRLYFGPFSRDRLLSL